ncbi:hypothetical protein Holit_03169 [Hollandina sp. SP2]
MHAQWQADSKPAPVQITLRPTPEDPSLSNAEIFKDESNSFTVAGTGYTAYQWYWNGSKIDGEDSNTYNLEANTKSPGVYEVSVVVTTDGGAKLSARCRVIIKDK